MINEICTRTRPWSGVRTAVVGFKVAVVGDRPKLPPEDSPLCPPQLRRLIRAMWAQQPEQRPSSGAVLAKLEAMLEAVEAGLPLPDDGDGAAAAAATYRGQEEAGQEIMGQEEVERVDEEQEQ